MYWILAIWLMFMAGVIIWVIDGASAIETYPGSTVTKVIDDVCIVQLEDGKEHAIEYCDNQHVGNKVDVELKKNGTWIIK